MGLTCCPPTGLSMLIYILQRCQPHGLYVLSTPWDKLNNYTQYVTSTPWALALEDVSTLWALAAKVLRCVYERLAGPFNVHAPLGKRRLPG